jgi:hypothetical protein
MKLDQNTNLRVEDYADQAKWIGRLFVTLTGFITQVQRIFDNNIDYTTNIRSTTRSYDTTALSFPVAFEWPYKQADPADLTVIKAMAGTDATVLIPAWSFDASTREISIEYMTEVSASGVAAPVTGTRYRFTVRATI